MGIDPKPKISAPKVDDLPMDPSTITMMMISIFMRVYPKMVWTTFSTKTRISLEVWQPSPAEKEPKLTKKRERKKMPQIWTVNPIQAWVSMTTMRMGSSDDS